MSADPDESVFDSQTESIFDSSAFPRYTEVSTGLRDAEGRLLQALKTRSRPEITSAKLDVMGALDEYAKAVSKIGEDPY